MVCLSFRLGTMKMKMNMKTNAFIFVFLFFICDTFCSALKTTFVRVKRWDNGDMGTGDMSNMFRGTAGVDYPDLKSIPNTNFRCEDQIYEGGLYADVETRCQVYHVCHDGRKNSFLCGPGTIFNQQILACDYWYSTECENAPSYYYVNSQIGNAVSPDNFGQYNNSPQNSGNLKPGDSRGVPYAGSNADQNTGQSCNCFKSSYNTPWSFPTFMMHGSDK